MARVQKPRKRTEGVKFNSNTRQTLGQRIRYLRANAKPYMTLRQLSTLVGIRESKLSAIENGDPKFINMELDTLRKIALALDVQIFINLKRKPDRRSEECQPLGHNLPPLPKLKRSWKEANLRLAAKFGSYQKRKFRRKTHLGLSKPTSDKLGSHPADDPSPVE